MSSIPKVGIYAGTFDPPTLGHTWMMTECSKLVDKLIIAVAENPAKKTMFTAKERVDMITNVTDYIDIYCAVETVQFSGTFLVHEAMKRGASMLLRGIRNTVDFEYEQTQRLINEEIANNYHRVSGSIAFQPITVYLSPPAKLGQVSSSMVKWLVGLEGWKHEVRRYVHPTIYQRIVEKHENIR